jgi:hypothetical protein
MKPTGKINPITNEEILQVEEKDITFWDKSWEELTLDEKAMICSLGEIPFLGEFNNEKRVKDLYNVYKLRHTFYY